MSDKKTVTTHSFISEFTIFIVFFALKVGGVIDWSWWIVTCPLWIPVVVIVAILLIIGIIAGLVLLGAWIADKFKYGF